VATSPTPEIPLIYDISRDQRRAITQQEVDDLVHAKNCSVSFVMAVQQLTREFTALLKKDDQVAKPLFGALRLMQ